MARKGEIVAGVDFGSRSVRVLVAQKLDDGTVKLLGHGVAPSQGCVIRGQIQNMDAAQAAFRKALKEATRTSGVRMQHIFLGVSSPRVESVIRDGTVAVSGGVVDHDNLEEARQSAANNSMNAPGTISLSSVSAQEWYVEGQRVAEPLKMRGSVIKARIHFARVPAVVINNLQACVESQDCIVEDLIYMPIAAALGCLTPEDMHLGVAVVDLGNTNTGVAVYRDSSIVGAHTFDWGTQLFCDDIAAGLKVPFDEAAKIFLEYGLSRRLIASLNQSAPEPELPIDPVARSKQPDEFKVRTVSGMDERVPKAKLENIVFLRGQELIDRLVGYLTRHKFLELMSRGIVITGGGANINHMDMMMETMCGVPVRTGLPNGIEQMTQSLNTPDTTPLVGIVRHGFEFRNAVRNGRVYQYISPTRRLVRRVGRTFSRYFF